MERNGAVGMNGAGCQPSAFANIGNRVARTSRRMKGVEKNFVTYFTWPTDAKTGEPLDWFRVGQRCRPDPVECLRKRGDLGVRAVRPRQLARMARTGRLISGP